MINLRAETYYSIGRSCLSPKDLAAMAKAASQTAVAALDRQTVAGLHKFSGACDKAGVTPIIGATVPLTIGVGQPRSIGLIAQTQASLPSLYRAVSRSLLQPLEADDPDLADLFVLTGADGGLMTGFDRHRHAIGEAIDILRRHANGFAIEVCRAIGPLDWEDALDPLFADLGEELPIVASSPARHRSDDDATALDMVAFMQRRRDTGRNDAMSHRNETPGGQHFKSSAEIAALFPDMPGAVDNLAILAARSTARISDNKPLLPRMPGMTADEECAALVAQAEQGLERIIRSKPLRGSAGDYRARLAYELGHITRLGFAGYFLIVADYIAMCRSAGIPVGPGRGSGAGSLVAYALGITNIDPIRFDLYFERFINPDRVSLPDFDIDFCTQRRDEVIDYVLRRYGADHVGRLAAYTTLKARGSFRVAGAYCSLTPGAIQRISSLIDADAETLSDARAHPALAQALAADAEADAAFALAEHLRDLPSAESEHAAGIVIADRPLTDLCALRPSDGSAVPTVQFDMKSAEAVGLVKFDFLGLSTLTIINRTIELARTHGHEIDVDAIPFEDADTFAMLNKGWTLRVFQLETGGMTKALRQVNPTVFEDLIALVALYRPGPMEYIPLYAARKAGEAQTTYPHPDLVELLKSTHGIIVYQEQVMAMAQIVAGYSLGEADLLRRAIGKKIPEEVAKQEIVFIDKCRARGMAEEEAKDLFAFVLPFAAYGFNKSHAAAYALISWQTAWLKRHHTAAFLAANMDEDAATIERLSRTIDEARRLGVTVLPVDINQSDARFTLDADSPTTIRYGLAALKGFGRDLAVRIEQERRVGGAFADLQNFARRCPFVPANQLQRLASAGAFDRMSAHRGEALASARALSQKHADDSQLTPDLFGNTAVSSAAETADLSLVERADLEEEAYGFRFSLHPTDAYRHLVEQGQVSTLADALTAARGATNTTVKALVDITGITTNGSGRQLRAALEDGQTTIELVLASALPAPVIDRRPFVAIVDIRNERGRLQMTAIRDLSIQDSINRPVHITLSPDAAIGKVLDGLRKLFHDKPGSSAVHVSTVVRRNVKTSMRWSGDVKDADDIRAIDGVMHVMVAS